MFSDPQRPSTWTQFKKGLCNNCWAGCCTLPVEASAADLIRLGLTTEEEAGLSLKKLAKRLMKEKIVRLYNQKSQLFLLEQKANSDCIYLDKNRLCTVYDKRPEVCRKFPSIGPKPGYCPTRKK